MVADAHAERLVDGGGPIRLRRSGTGTASSPRCTRRSPPTTGGTRSRGGRCSTVRPGSGSFAAVLEVLAGAAAWTPGAGRRRGVRRRPAGRRALGVRGRAPGREPRPVAAGRPRPRQVLAAATGRTPSLPPQDPVGSAADGRPGRPGRRLGRHRARRRRRDHPQHGRLPGRRRHGAVTRRQAPAHRRRPLSEGRLDWARLRLLLTRTRDLTVEHAQAVEALRVRHPRCPGRRQPAGSRPP